MYIQTATLKDRILAASKPAKDLTDQSLKSAIKRLTGKESPSSNDKKRLRDLKQELKNRTGTDKKPAAKSGIKSAAKSASSSLGDFHKTEHTTPEVKKFASSLASEVSQALEAKGFSGAVSELCHVAAHGKKVSIVFTVKAKGMTFELDYSRQSARPLTLYWGNAKGIDRRNVTATEAKDLDTAIEEFLKKIPKAKATTPGKSAEKPAKSTDRTSEEELATLKRRLRELTTDYHKMGYTFSEAERKLRVKMIREDIASIERSHRSSKK